MTREERELRLTYFSSPWEWYVELDGRRIARLHNAENIDWNFWYSYSVELLVEDCGELETIYELGCGPRIKFKCVHCGLIAEGAMTSGAYSDEAYRKKDITERRVAMRGLYLNPPQPTLWEHFLLWRIGRKRRQAISAEKRNSEK